MLLRFDSTALGRPYHAARNRFAPRAPGSARHSHADFHELMAVLGGSGEHQLGTRSVRLRAGDVVLVRQRDQHAITGLPPDGLDFINIAFPTSVWHGFLDLTRTDPGDWEASPEPPVLRPDPERQAAVRTVFETVLERFQDGPTAYDLVRFWIDLLPLVSPHRLPLPVPVDQPRPDWLAEACRAMRKEDNLRAGVPRLQELAGVSPAHLSRSMRVHYATTPTAFVADLRLEHAAALLATTSLPVATIATRSGFGSQSYFSRCFTAVHQLSPREFRRNAQRAFVP